MQMTEDRDAWNEPFHYLEFHSRNSTENEVNTFLETHTIVCFFVRTTDEGLTLEITALILFTEANLGYQLSWKY